MHRRYDGRAEITLALVIRPCFVRDVGGPIRRQLLGSGPSGASGFTSPSPEDVPLRDYLRHYFGEEGLSKLQKLLPLTEEDLLPQADPRL